jgi:oligoribonuclease NrnB/cAMP/cGMP phosphodiesterase (DHH superfamily)
MKAKNITADELDNKLKKIGTEDEYIELLNEIIKNQYYSKIHDFTNKYLTKIRERILSDFPVSKELITKLAELVRLNTKSLENGTN